MYQHILAPIDGSELSLQAGGNAIALAKLFGARLSAVMVCPSLQQLMDKGYFPLPADADRNQWEQDMARHAREILARFEAQASSAGVTCGTVFLMDDHPYHAIVETAKENGCDLIVMGSHGHGRFKQWILGSETTGVLSHTKIPVLVYR